MADAIARDMRAALVVAAFVTACSAPDCPEEEYDCQGSCVFEGGYLTSACGRFDGCIQCPDEHRPHSSPACLGWDSNWRGRCGISCERSYGDCNHDPTDGCETRLDADPLNCGGCGQVCNGTCTAAGCIETLAEAEGSPSGLVADHDRVYWTARDGGALEIRTSQVVGGATTVAEVVAGDGLPATLALDKGTLFMSTGSADGGGSVVSIPLDGGEPLVIAEALDEPARMAIDGPTVYWTEFAAGVVRAAAGGAVHTVISGRNHPGEISADAGVVYWREELPDGGAGIFGVATDGGDAVYLSEGSNPSGPYVSAGGLEWVDVATASHFERSWRDFAHVSRFVGYGAPLHVSSSAADRYYGIVFWTDPIAHAVRVSDSPCAIVSGEPNPDWVALGLGPQPNYDDALYAGFHVFWVEGSRIRRLTTTSAHPWGQWCVP
jgi:hypothetical protein